MIRELSVKLFKKKKQEAYELKEGELKMTSAKADGR